MNSNSVSIAINDVFDELKAENQRLRAELLVANKCIEVLAEFKFFLDSIRVKLSDKLDDRLLLTFERLDDKYKTVVESRSKHRTNTKTARPTAPHKWACDWVGCHFGTARKSRLNAHRNYHTGDRPFVCALCLKRFVGRESLNTHQKTVHEKPVTCRLVTTNRRKVFTLLADEKPFACVQCEYRSRTRQALREHKWTHATRSLQCALCPKRFKSQKQLKSHALTHAETPPFKCDVSDCCAAFRTRKTLRIHRSKHENLAPRFACDWPGCDFCSHYNWICVRHRQIHTGEKPFKCTWPNCEQRFRRAHYLRQHELKHTGEKPFACEWPGCERAFRSLQAMRSHRKKHF